MGVRLRPSRWRSLITRRRAVQALVGAALYWAIGPGGVPLTWVILGGSAAGILLGKFFCRWMCPMGAVMELVTGRGGDSAQRHYLYFKLGCPIAWAGGLLNRLSLWRVKLRPERCTGCERCDEVCYVSQLAEGRSLHVAGQVNASTDYTCSRCLSCVAACPTGALTVGLVGRRAVPAGARARPHRPRSPAAPSRT
ncbi:MAG TPA: 4Fe-4S binding protein [Anaeromyxobacter sp.]